MVGPNVMFVLALGVEVIFVLFFLIKSAFSYEASLNRALDKLNYWLFEKKVVTEDNIKDLNMLFKTKAPKRLCYYWQQYILFREGDPSKYLSVENLVDKPLKTSSYNSNIKNLSLFTTLWALVTSVFVLLATNSESYLLGKSLATALLIPIFVVIIGVVFIVFMRARKNSILNSLYQNVSLFGRFMDNACVDLPSYIDYQILFTPQEIEKGQPVLREFMDYKARKEKEEFARAKEEKIDYEIYDFSSAGVDGSIVLDRAMKESELYLKKKDKILVKVSQLESELDSRRKNFDMVQKDFQTKIQASKENVTRLRQMQEETTNRIESNFYRKQQTQEISKQEQLEQEFEQQRTKYLLEKQECEQEIAKYNKELEQQKTDVTNVMLGEYQTFFNKFCHSAELVVGKVFADKINGLKQENEADKQRITDLEIQLKNIPQGQYNADQTADQTQQPEYVEEAQPEQAQPQVQVNNDIPPEGMYDEHGNYLYPNGSYYDTEGYFHDEYGNIYTQDGELIKSAPEQQQTEAPAVEENPQPEKTEPETPAQEPEKEPEKTVVNFDDMNDFDFMTDVSQKGAVYGVAENIVNDVDKGESVEVINNNEMPDATKTENKAVTLPLTDEEKPVVSDDFDDFVIDDSDAKAKVEAEPKKKEKKEKVEEPKTEAEQKPKKKVGRPKKVKTEETPKPAGKRGRPKKEKVEEKNPTPKRKAGRPKKIVNKPAEEEKPKKGRGRPRKINIQELNEKLSEEEAKLNEIRTTLNKELEQVVNGMNENGSDEKQAKRDEIIKEIEKLQEEAKSVIEQKESDQKIEEINTKIENLLQEVKKLSE